MDPELVEEGVAECSFVAHHRHVRVPFSFVQFFFKTLRLVRVGTKHPRDQNMSVRPLVRVESGSLVADESTLGWLASLDPRRLSVVMCAGKFRTGKSFLLNRLLGFDPGEGFGVGDTVQACTRGVWVSTKLLEGSDGGQILVCDTEGIDALDVESEHDVRIFALAVLLGSVFCYNSTSHIDEAAVQTLSLLTRVASSLDNTLHRPVLYWVLRDFELQLVDNRGNPMSHEAYLEAALHSPEGASASKCSTREAISSIFLKRHLVTLPRPHKGDGVRLEQKRGGSVAVNAKFAKYLQVFRSHLCTHSPPVHAHGVDMTGAVFSEHVRNVVRLLNESGSVPPLEDAWTLLVRTQHADAWKHVRQAVLDKVQTECPRDVEGRVREYIRSLVSEARGEVHFMPPAPEGNEEELVEEVLRLARSMSKVVDMDELARNDAEAAINRATKPSLPQNWDLLSLLASELEWGNDQGGDFWGYSSKLLTSFVKESWPRVRSALEQTSSALEKQVRETEALEEELVQSARRETALRQDVACLQPPEREDAATSTEDLLPEEEEAVVVEPISVGTTTDECTLEWEAKVEEQEARARRAEERCTSFERGLEMLKAQAIEESKKRDEDVATAKKEVDLSRKEADHLRSQKEAMDAELEEMRALVRDGQNKAVDVHRQVLEEARRRDAEARAQQDSVRKEHSEMFARAEVAEREARSLKRRVEELLESDKEVKRIRGMLREHEVSSARLQAEVDGAKSALTTTRNERDVLRRSNTELSNRVSVLEASAALESCRRSLSGKIEE